MNGDEFDRAVSAYARKCEREGLSFDQPSRALSDESGDRVILRNHNGHLATYAITERGLHYVEADEENDTADELAAA